jgi:restriction endonuclease S subunit
MTPSSFEERFDLHMTREWKKHTDKFSEANNSQFESGYDVAQAIAEKFIKSELDKQRMELLEERHQALKELGKVYRKSADQELKDQRVEIEGEWEGKVRKVRDQLTMRQGLLSSLTVKNMLSNLLRSKT